MLEIIGAELHNLLKLFDSLVDGQLKGVPALPASNLFKNVITY